MYLGEPPFDPHGLAVRAGGHVAVGQHAGEPDGGFQQIGVRAENGRQAASSCGDALNVRPAAGKGFVEEYPGQLFGPG